MIWFDLQIGEKKGTAARLIASALWFDRNENRVNLLESLGVVTLDDPAFLGRVVLIENPEVQSLVPVRAALSPSLKRTRIPGTGLLVKIVGVEDQRLSLGVEDPAVGLLRHSVTSDTIQLGDMEFPGPHQFPHIAVMSEQVLLFAESLLSLAKLCMEIVDLRS